jgi:hypothetical protein
VKISFRHLTKEAQQELLVKIHVRYLKGEGRVLAIFDVANEAGIDFHILMKAWYDSEIYDKYWRKGQKENLKETSWENLKPLADQKSRVGRNGRNGKHSKNGEVHQLKFQL